MEEIIKLDEVDKYNKFFGLETRHPLVSVVDLSKATRWPEHFRINYWVYALFLKDTRCGDIMYGRQSYDYQDGTIVSFAPGQVVETEMSQNTRPNAHGILFHPDLIRGTALGQEIRNYSFFSYETREALHLSEEERQTVMDCLYKIEAELKHGIDKHSRRLITATSGCSRLLYAFLRTAVHHARRGEQRHHRPFRTVVGRLFRQRGPVAGGTADRQILCRQGVSFGKPISAI